jgi:hypothetical protein
MFFEDDGESLNGENGFHDMEVLAEEEEGLHLDFLGLQGIERCCLFGWPIVGLCIVVEYLLQTVLYFIF